MSYKNDDEGKKMRIFRDPIHYSKHSALQKKLAKQVLRGLSIEEKRVLDVGCGDGEITEWIKQKGASQSIGVDLSTSMIEFAKRIHLNCVFYSHDITVPLQEEVFDVVTSFNCLHWVDDLSSALTNIYDALKVGGDFRGVIYPRCNDIWLASEVLSESSLYAEYFKDFRNPYQFYTVDNFEKRLSEAGFTECVVSQESCTQRFSCESSFIEYIRGWMPHFQNSPTQFSFDWLNLYKCITAQDGVSGISMPYDVIFFECKKMQ